MKSTLRGTCATLAILVGWVFALTGLTMLPGCGTTPEHSHHEQRPGNNLLKQGDGHYGECYYIECQKEV